MNYRTKCGSHLLCVLPCSFGFQESHTGTRVLPTHICFFLCTRSTSWSVWSWQCCSPPSCGCPRCGTAHSTPPSCCCRIHCHLVLHKWVNAVMIIALTVCVSARAMLKCTQGCDLVQIATTHSWDLCPCMLGGMYWHHWCHWSQDNLSLITFQVSMLIKNLPSCFTHMSHCSTDYCIDSVCVSARVVHDQAHKDVL